MQAILLAHAGYFVGPCTLTVHCGLCQHVENKCDRPEGITHTYNARQENNSTLCLRYRILSFYWIYFISHISIRLLWRYRYSIEVTLAEFKWEGQQTETLLPQSKHCPALTLPHPALWGIRSMFHSLLWKKCFGHTLVTAGCEELCLFA